MWNNAYRILNILIGIRSIKVVGENMSSFVFLCFVVVVGVLNFLYIRNRESLIFYLKERNRFQRNRFRDKLDEIEALDAHRESDVEGVELMFNRDDELSNLSFMQDILSKISKQSPVVISLKDQDIVYIMKSHNDESNLSKMECILKKKGYTIKRIVGTDEHMSAKSSPSLKFDSQTKASKSLQIPFHLFGVN